MEMMITNTYDNYDDNGDDNYIILTMGTGSDEQYTQMSTGLRNTRTNFIVRGCASPFFHDLPLFEQL